MLQVIDGKKLRKLREGRGITQAQIAAELSVSKQTISQTERTPNVGVEAAERYLNAVETIVCRLLGREDEATPIRIETRVVLGHGGYWKTAGEFTESALREAIS